MNGRNDENRKNEIRESGNIFVIDSDFWVRHFGFCSGQRFWKFYNSIFVPKTFRNFASQSGCAGQAGAVTRFLSTWALSMSMERKSEPAAVTSGPMGRIGGAGAAFQYIGCDENLDGVADGRRRVCRLEEMTDELDDAGVKAEIFGARPPGEDEGVVMFRAISSKVALRVKLWPGFSE